MSVFCCIFAPMKTIINPRLVRIFLIATLLSVGQSMAFAADGDSVTVIRHDCCADSTVEDHTTPYHKIVKEGGSMREGLFTVRHIKDAWYLEVPDSLLGRLLLAVTRFTSVPQDFRLLSGEEVNRSTVYLEQYGEKSLFMREYVQSKFAKPGEKIGEALQQSTIDPIVYKFDVIGRNPDTQAQLIDITKLLLSDNKIMSFSNEDRSQLGIGTVQSDRTFIDTIKTYPINLEITTLRTYGMNPGKVPASKTGSATLSLNTSIVLLPRNPMRPRLFDERVGFFNNKVTHFSDDESPEHDAIVSRYRLEPKDPKAYRAGKLTEPKKQIVYYIDPATPRKWVPYLKAGINDWNKAFEAAGFKNAIVAKDWPNDPNMSLDDARFSVLRYLPSETENAYGPRIVDPRSGEIIEAHICWYHNVMNLVRKWYMTQCGPLDKRAQKMDFPDELMGQLIRFVSSHEVGHTLGLRHNMGSSSQTPVEKLRDKAWVEKHGHTASIMDYARFNYVAQPEDKIGEKGLFPRINDYDLWAIKWGYQYRPEFKDAFAEKKVLRHEVTATLQQNPRLWWVGDEGKGPDPRSQAEDLGDDNVKASDYGIKNLKRVMEHILDWTAQPDGQYDDLSTIHRQVRAQFMRYMGHVQKNLAGKYIDNRPGFAPYSYVPRERQKAAVDWLGRNVLTAPLWLYPQEVVSRLGIDDVDEIQNRQHTLLALLLAPGMVNNLYNVSLRSANAYPVEEYLDDVFATVWKPLNDKNEQINNYRRQQQRTYIYFLGRALNPVTGEKDATGNNTSTLRSDAILFMEKHLDKVENYLKQQNADGLNRQHYDNLLLQIKKIREKYTSADK